MAERSFKNVGSTVKQIQTASPVQQTFPIGIKTPMSLSTNGNPYTMNTSIAEQIQDNLRNLLLTNWGERIGIYKYGANLRSVLSEMSTTENIDSVVMKLINDAVSSYMPFVSLETFDMKFLPTDQNAQAKYQIIINYSVPKINAKNQKVKIILEALG